MPFYDTRTKAGVWFEIASTVPGLCPDWDYCQVWYNSSLYQLHTLLTTPRCQEVWRTWHVTRSVTHNYNFDSQGLEIWESAQQLVPPRWQTDGLGPLLFLPLLNWARSGSCPIKEEGRCDWADWESWHQLTLVSIIHALLVALIKHIQSPQRLPS